MITIPSVIIPITLATLAAYAFAWMHFPGRNILFIAIFALQIVPIQCRERGQVHLGSQRREQAAGVVVATVHPSLVDERRPLHHVRGGFEQQHAKALPGQLDADAAAEEAAADDDDVGPPTARLVEVPVHRSVGEAVPTGRGGCQHAYRLSSLGSGR